LKTEAELQQKLLERLDVRLPDAVVFKHADTLTSGIPDVSMTFNGYTSWWELKRSRTPKAPISGTELQRQNMRRLSLASGQCAWYIVWEPTATLIVHPSEVDRGGVLNLRDGQSLRAYPAEEYERIVQFMMRLHYNLLPQRKHNAAHAN